MLEQEKVETAEAELATNPASRHGSAGPVAPVAAITDIARTVP